MRKDRFLLFVLLFSIILVNAQEEELPKKLSFGISTGFSGSIFSDDISRLGLDESLDYKSYFRFGANVHFKLFYRLNDYVRLQSGLSYIGKGQEYRKKNTDVVVFGDNGSNNGYYKTRFRLDYIEIPLLMGINLKKVFKDDEFDYKPIFLKLGVSSGFNIKSDVRKNDYVSDGELFGPFEKVSEEFVEQDFDYAKKVVPNLLLGLSFVHHQEDNYKLTINIDYSRTLVKSVYEESLINDSYSFRTNINTFSLGFGVEF